MTDHLDEIFGDLLGADELDERLEPRPFEGDTIRRMAITFGIPVHVMPDQYRRLTDLIEEIVKAPYNQPRNGVHWVSGEGAPPNLYDDGPPDTSVHRVSCSARGFVSDKERARVELERTKTDDCPQCGLPRFNTPSGPVCKNGHGG